MRLSAICSAAAFAVSASVASAATYNISGDFSGGKLGDVEFDFDVTSDFTTNSNGAIPAADVNKLTSDIVIPAGDLTYSYNLTSANSDFDVFTFFYSQGDILIFVTFDDVFGVSPNFRVINDSLNQLDINAEFGCFDTIQVDVCTNSPFFTSDITPGSLSVKLVSDEETPAVPLPASVLMLSGGLLGLGALGRRRRKAVN